MSSFSGDPCWVPADKSRKWHDRFMGKILRCGIIPKHVAFIMDGNRTFAKENSLQKNTIHERGFGKLIEILQWCLDMGIYEVTAWAFSIENFKRTKAEVDILMDLARDRFRKLILEWRNLEESGICVRVIGNLTLLPKDLLCLILTTMLLTRNNNRLCLNIALSYTSKDEITSTSNLMLHGIRKREMSNTKVNADLIDRCLYTCLSEPPDIIVRTSGQYRLSDFLMWQGAYSYLHITNVLWPGLSIWNFLYAIFCYQNFVRRSPRPLKRRYKLEHKNVYEFAHRLQTYRLREAIEVCERGGQPLNWEMLNQFTKSELYEYYLKNLSDAKKVP